MLDSNISLYFKLMFENFGWGYMGHDPGWLNQNWDWII